MASNILSARLHIFSVPKTLTRQCTQPTSTGTTLLPTWGQTSKAYSTLTASTALTRSQTSSTTEVLHTTQTKSSASLVKTATHSICKQRVAKSVLATQTAASVSPTLTNKYSTRHVFTAVPAFTSQMERPTAACRTKTDARKANLLPQTDSVCSATTLRKAASTTATRAVSSRKDSHWRSSATGVTMALLSTNTTAAERVSNRQKQKPAAEPATTASLSSAESCV